MQEKSNNSRNVPNLRFPGFVGEWRNTKIGDICNIIGGGTPDTSNIKFWDGDIQWFTPTEIKENFVSKSNRTITELGLKKSSAKILPKGTILLTTRATIGEAAIADNECSTNQGFQSLVVKKEYDNIFVFNWLKLKKHELTKRANGSTFPEISKSEIEKIDIQIPFIQEQQKIGSLLSLIDQRISTQSQIINQLESLKRSLCKEIFNQNFRFKDDNGNDYPEWKYKRLKELGTFYSGGTPLTTKKNYYNGNIPFIKSGEIHSNITAQFISEEGLKNSSAKMIKTGDVIYALYGATSGEVAISKMDGAINQAILRIKTSLNNTFLVNYLQFMKQRILKTYLQGGQGNLSAEIIKSLLIPTPSIEEQSKIANFLSSIDKKIETEKQLLKQYEEQKKYLLQNLFI